MKSTPREWRVGRFYVREGVKRPSRAARAPARWPVWTSSGLAAVLGVEMAIRHGLTWKQAPMMVAGAAMVGVLVARIVAARRMKVLMRELEAAGYRVCLKCRYDLRGVEAEEGRVVCPECGDGVDVTTLRQEWEKRLRGMGMW